MINHGFLDFSNKYKNAHGDFLYSNEIEKVCVEHLDASLCEL